MSTEWELAKHYPTPRKESQNINAPLGTRTKLHQSLMTEPNTSFFLLFFWQLLSEKSSSPSEKNCLMSAPLHIPGFMWPWGGIKIFPPQGKSHLDAAAFERELLT